MDHREILGILIGFGSPTGIGTRVIFYGRGIAAVRSLAANTAAACLYRIRILRCHRIESAQLMLLSPLQQCTVVTRITVEIGVVSGG